MVILTAVNGGIELRDQLRDYKFRGEELAQMNFLEFMLNTYEDSTKENGEGEANEFIQNAPEEAPRTRGPGRPRSVRIPYQDEARKGKRCRIVRLQGHETLPTFVGKWFSRSDNDYERDLYRANMLMLLKPWRNLHQLKNPTETFEKAYDQFLSQADQKSCRVIANVQYFHECSDGAKAEREKAKQRPQQDHAGPNDNIETEFNIDIDDMEEIEEIHAANFSEITNDNIERAYLMKTNARERLYGESAVNLGYDVGFFTETEEDVTYTYAARKLQDDEGQKIRTWETQLKATTREQMNTFGTINILEEPNEAEASIGHAEPARTAPEIRPQRKDQPLADHVNKDCIKRLELANLNEEQRRAHDIIEEKLIEHITSKL